MSFPFPARESFMSIYGYLNCHDCMQMLWLGKALSDRDTVFAFHIGGADEPRHWKQEQLNQVLWKFLADHVGHRIDVRLESEMSEEMSGYQEIGGDTENDITFEEYL